MFKSKSPEERAENARVRLERTAAREGENARREAERQRAAFLASPVGCAQTAFEHGDHLFQYAHDVESQAAIIVAMIGSTTSRSSTDPSDILNAVCRQGWELVNASFVFREQGSQSRDKFLSSGQNVAVKGTTVGYYLFRRQPENREADQRQEPQRDAA